MLVSLGGEVVIHRVLEECQAIPFGRLHHTEVNGACCHKFGVVVASCEVEEGVHAEGPQPIRDRIILGYFCGHLILVLLLVLGGQCAKGSCGLCVCVHGRVRGESEERVFCDPHVAGCKLPAVCGGAGAGCVVTCREVPHHQLLEENGEGMVHGLLLLPHDHGVHNHEVVLPHDATRLGNKESHDVVGDGTDLKGFTPLRDCVPYSVVSHF